MLDWRLVGPSYWPNYRDCILATIEQSGVDTTTTFGSLSGTDKWVGGVLAPNGMIYGVPYYATTVLKIDPDSIAAFCANIIQSAYFNKL
jgi:hypothetical protein